MAILEKLFKTSGFGFVLIAAMLLAAAGYAHDKKHKHTGPPPVRAGVAGFDIYSDGGVLHLLTADFGDGRGARALSYRRSSDEGRTWSAPVRVNSDGTQVYDLVRGNDPQIAARGSNIVAVWTAKGSGYGDSGPLVTAVSKDGGKTWQPGGNPADDASTAGHAYTEILAGPQGFDLVWLDGRDGAQGLRHARLAADSAKWSVNATVHRGRTWSAPYRTGSTEARRADLNAHEDGRILVTWDQLDGKRRSIYTMQSADSGARWFKAARISSPEADAMYPRAVATRSGFLVLWTETTTGPGPVLKQSTIASTLP